MKSSKYSGFYKLSIDDRLKEIAEYAGLSAEEQKILLDPGSLTMDKADHMVENVIGRYALPMGVGLNYLVNGKDYVVPMVTEEPSVIAAASNAAKMIRDSGGFFASNTGSIMIAQVQIVGVPDPFFAKNAIYEHKAKIVALCNEKDPMLVQLGGGMVDLDVRVIDTQVGPMVIVHLKVNTLDAMGANAVNTMAEAIAPYLEEITGGTVYLRILSNLAVHRLVRVRAKVLKEILGGPEVVDKLLIGHAFAAADPYRAATHNKGIMNGISSVVLATGNDTRAIESGVHSYASISGRYSSIVTWEKDREGNLCGSMEIPMAVGLVGGATKVHPAAGLAIKILGVKSAPELGEVIVCVGLTSSLASLKALATEGIQKGHMSLHARNLAGVAGATGEMIDRIAKQMVEDRKIRLEYAQELFAKYSR
jgi:hydroxymethylglutaryl-CoA reductase